MDALLYWGAVLLPGPLALLLGRWRPEWTSARVATISAAPIPLCILFYALFMLGVGMVTPAAKCGVDACGMIVVVAMMMAFAGVGLFAVGWAVAMVAQRVLPRTRVGK